ncbi:MAG TPA: hypothetical protein DCO72_08120 [Ruminococcus sp.]|nr:hypothetical protein [Ruminococcus sp.]
MNDYAHYGECKSLMLLYQKRHMQRFYALVALVMMNLYFYMPFLVTKYQPTSLTAYYSQQPNEQAGILGNVGIGVPVLMICAVMIRVAFKQTNEKKKWGLIFGSIALMGGVTIYIQSQRAKQHIDNGVNFQNPAFALGIVTVLLGIGCVAMAFLAEQKRPVAFYILLVLLVIGLIWKLFAWWCVIPVLIVYTTEIPEIRKMRWIMQQEGYPYFNERFSEQLEHTEYVPIHKLDGIKTPKKENAQTFTESFGAEGEMPSVSLDDVPELSNAEDLNKMREQVAHLSENTGIGLEKISAVPETMLKESISLEKRDFPDILGSSESSGMDTSFILSKPTDTHSESGG